MRRASPGTSDHCTCSARKCLSPWRVRELRRGLPQQRLTGWPAATPALRRGPLLVTSPPRDVPGSAPLPQRRAVGAPRSQPPSPDPRGRRAEVRGAGDAAIRTQGAAWGQRAPRARAPVAAAEPRGACARRGRGARACVCVGAGWAAARCSFRLRTGPDLEKKAVWPLSIPITSSTFAHSLHPPTPHPSTYQNRSQ